MLPGYGCMAHHDPKLRRSEGMDAAAATRLTAIADGLGARGWHVCPNFFRPEQVARLAAEARVAWEGGDFRPARVGAGHSPHLSAAIRGDHTLWLERARSPLEEFHAAIEALRLAVNGALFLGLFEFEGHFAVYPPGTFYRRHLDQFDDDRSRQLSCVLYLNEAWVPAHGGVLRLYTEGRQYVDIAPCGGTLVTFLSERFYHEVLPNTVERYSLTGWFRTRR